MLYNTIRQSLAPILLKDSISDALAERRSRPYQSHKLVQPKHAVKERSKFQWPRETFLPTGANILGTPVGEGD